LCFANSYWLLFLYCNDSGITSYAHLTRSYHHGQSCINAVVGLTLAVERGQRIAIIGRSGSGKSTLLNLLAGLDRPTVGTLAVNGQRLDQLSRTQMAEYRLKTSGQPGRRFFLQCHCHR